MPSNRSRSVLMMASSHVPLTSLIATSRFPSGDQSIVGRQNIPSAVVEQARCFASPPSTGLTKIDTVCGLDSVEKYAIRLPSGDQEGLNPVAILSGWPPVAGTTMMFEPG